jgi:hypothetical protein
MIPNRYSSPISSPITSPITQAAIIPDEDMDSITEWDSFHVESDSSSVEWWVPENQLGLEPPLDDQFGFRRDDQVVALDNEGEIKHHEAIAKH